MLRSIPGAAAWWLLVGEHEDRLAICQQAVGSFGVLW